MSIVAVHGPNMWGGTGAGGGGSGAVVQSTPAGGGTVTANMSNGRQFTFAGAGNRAAADYDWTFTGETAQPNVQSGTVTFATTGTKTITLTLGSSGGTTPAPGTYTFTVESTGATGGMPRSFAPPSGGNGEPPPEEPYDPADHTIDDVKQHVEEHPDEVEAIYDAEIDGKGRTTLLTWLEGLLPA